MWRHSPHQTHERCEEISDFSTSVMRRNLKSLHMWRKFRILPICHAQKSEISPHDKFFLHGYIREIRDKYEVCPKGALCKRSTATFSFFHSGIVLRLLFLSGFSLLILVCFVSSDRSSLRYDVLLYIPLFEIFTQTIDSLK